MLFCHVTTHVDGDPYPNLLREKGGTGFPTLLFLDADGAILAHQGERSVAAFERTASALQELRSLEAKVAAGDTSAAPGIVLAKLELGAYTTRAAAEAALAAAGKLDEAAAKRAEGLLLKLEFAEIVAAARKPGAKVDLGATCAEWLRAGKIPAGDTATFYTSIMTFAEKQRDAALFATARDANRKARGNDERFRVIFATEDLRLARLVRLAELAERAKSGDPKAEFEVVLTRIERGELDKEAALAAIAATKVDATTKATAEPWLLGYDVKARMATARTQEQRAELQKECVAMFRAGKVPRSACQPFFMNVLLAADQAKDTELVAKVVAAAKEAAAAEPSLLMLVSRYDTPAKAK